MKPESGFMPRILVKDFKKMYDFYKDVLEYEVHWGDRDGSYASFKVPGEKDPSFAIYIKDYSYYEGYSDIGNQTKSDFIVLTLNHSDVDEYYNDLKAKGIEFVGEPRDIYEWYCRVVLFRDPEGNLLEINGPYKDIHQ